MTFRNYLCNVKLTLKSFLQMKYIMIMHLLLLFLATTLPAMLMYSNYSSRKWNMGEWERGEIISYLSGRSEFLMVLIPAAAFVASYIAFSHLYRRRSAVFYGSIPRKRSSVYLSQLTAAIFSSVLPYLVITLLNLAVLKGYELDITAGVFWGKAGFIILQYAALVVLFSFAASISGNFFAQIISTGFVFLVYPVTIVLAAGIIETCFNTYQLPLYLDEGYIVPWVELNSVTVEPKYAVFTAVAAVIFLALGLWAYVKRKTENSELFFGFRFINVFLKYYVSAVAAIGGGVIIGEVGNNGIVATYLGCLFFGFLVFCIIQGIFEKSFKAMFSNLKGFAVLGALVVVLITIPVLDPFGIDSSVPSLKSVAISPIDSYFGYYGSEKSGIELKASENLKAAERVMKAGIENTLEFRRLEDMGVAVYEQERFYKAQSMSFYVNNNMLGITRELNWIPIEEYLEFVGTVYDSAEYKQGYADLIINSGSTNFSISKGAYYDAIAPEDDADRNRIATEKLMKVLTEDIRRYSFEDIKNSSVYCEIDFYGGKHLGVMVYSCFEETVKYIKENLVVDRTESFEGNSLKLTYTNDTETEEFHVTEKEQITEILRKTGFRTNLFSEYAGKVYSVFSGDINYDGGSYFGEIPESELPDGVK